MDGPDLLDKMHRHDLLFLDKAGTKAATEAALLWNPHLSREEIKRIIAPGIPGIVRRQEARREGFIEVGFSAPYYTADGTRLRAAAPVALAGVLRCVTPWEALECAKTGPRGTLLVLMEEEGQALGLRVGLFGSYALRAVTGLPYTREDSDLDLTVEALHPDADTAGMLKVLEEAQKEHEIAIDAEYQCGGYGVKLKELCGAQKTVLGKGLYDACLLDAESVRAGSPKPWEDAGEWREL